MMILAYFRIKFSSLKINSERVDWVAMPGSAKKAAFLVRWQNGPSRLVAVSPSSCRLVFAWKLATLEGGKGKEKRRSRSVMVKVKVKVMH